MLNTGLSKNLEQTYLHHLWPVHDFGVGGPGHLKKYRIHILNSPWVSTSLKPKKSWRKNLAFQQLNKLSKTKS